MLKYVLKDGTREKGPFMLDDLKYQRIRPSTLVKIDDGEWKPISEVPDLRFLLKLKDHSNGASYADKQVAYGDTHRARLNPRVALAIGLALALMAIGMAFFFLMPAPVE